MHPQKSEENIYIVEKNKKMHVPLKIFASEKVLEQMQKDICITQGTYVAQLPGIKDHALMMPDAHQGYGFPIGGVAAFDEHEGCISPGGVGFDINCGMRALVVDCSYEDIQDKLELLIDKIYEYVPVGVGRESHIKLTHEQLDEVLRKGALWAVEKGYGTQDDLQRTEEEGCMQEADPSFISPRAKKRGKNQLGTLGAGNHFLEIQRVADILDQKAASVMGITKNDQIIIMIHTGSRGLGHQTCTDYIRKIEDQYPEIINSLPEKDLAYAPIESELAQQYYKAMCAAMNFAWANRQVITGQIRRACKEVFGDNIAVHQIYDMSHNNAKKELHSIDGNEQTVWVHRKGAARAFPPFHEHIPTCYKEIGQPVIIPGSMGTASYLLVGKQEGMTKSFGTTCHGAGRIMSRKKAMETLSPEQVFDNLKKKNVHIKSGSKRGVVDEAPEVYKDIHEIVKICEDVGLAKIVVQLKPVGVVKG